MSVTNLDEVVLEGLKFLATNTLQPANYRPPEPTLVVASGNAFVTGKLLFQGFDVHFADETDFQQALNQGNFNSAVVISASGEKHAPIIVRALLKKNLPIQLISCVAQSSASQLLPAERVLVSPAQKEPLTYNTSTYLGMILAKTREQPEQIAEFIQTEVDPLLANIGRFQAYYLMPPDRFEPVTPMFVTKFDELFGGRVAGRCYTPGQTLHAKTVVPWEQELFISFGDDNPHFGSQRLHIPLPTNADYGAVIAIGYYTIGKIQAQKEPWFADYVATYTAEQKRWFEAL